MDEKAPYLPHAPSPVSLGAILAGVGVMACGMAAALGAAAIVSHFVPSPLGAPNNAQRPEIAGPVQRTAPALERDAFMQEKNERLHGSGVDPVSGETFVPIEKAMKAMAAPAPLRGKAAP